MPVTDADWSAAGLLASGFRPGKKRKSRPAAPEIRPTITPAFLAMLIGPRSAASPEPALRSGVSAPEAIGLPPEADRGRELRRAAGADADDEPVETCLQLCAKTEPQDKASLRSREGRGLAQLSVSREAEVDTESCARSGENT